jgi:hypothetical protein
MSGLLVIMGSGETAPTMIKPHRAIFERVGARPAVLIDTPYGFQSNADDISARAVNYFAASVGREVGVVSWRTPPPAGLQQERTLAAMRAAGWVFAGPGSPTYALRQWRDTAIETAWADVLARDGVLLLASAAALTLGSHTVPVYEIYKAGLEPYWETGLDLVRQFCGLPAVVIPHYDNAEGGHHDTRYCYLGEERLAAMERELPEGSFIRGVDEHTAVQLDPAGRTATVTGNGTLTLRRAGRSVVFASGSVLTFDQMLSLDEMLTSDQVTVPAPRTPGDDAAARPAAKERSHSAQAQAAEAAVPPSLWGDAVRLATRFDESLERRDADSCVEAVLALEQAIVDWAADTNVSDEAERARAQLRAMIVRLGELAVVGARDPRTVVGPFVEGLLELRRRARQSRDWAASDWVRDHLAAAGVEVRDTQDGPQWQLSDGAATRTGST